MLKIVALYKTWSGNEFVIPSIESIYNHVDKIVFVHSDVSWNGEHGNTVRDTINHWKRNHDLNNKVISLDFNSESQEKQYDFGFGYIKDNLIADYVMLVDTDEVWTGKDLDAAHAGIIADGKGHDVYTCNMHTYIKSPFYRITTSEPCKPTIFVSTDVPSMAGPRGSGLKNRKLLEDVYMHHFTLVRNSTLDIRKKIFLSNKSDGNKAVDMNTWFADKWDNLPNGENLHMSSGYEHYWDNVTVVGKGDLPEVFRNSRSSIIENHLYEEVVDIVDRHTATYDYYNIDFLELLNNEIEMRPEVDFMELVKFFIKDCKNSRILEIGTLVGLNLFALEEFGCTDLTGIEFVPEAIVAAKSRESNIVFVEGTFPCNLGKTFSQILLFDTLEHVPNVETFLQGVESILEPGGSLYVLVPKDSNWIEPVHINYYPDINCLRNILNKYFIINELFELNGKIFARVGKK